MKDRFCCCHFHSILFHFHSFLFLSLQIDFKLAPFPHFPNAQSLCKQLLEFSPSQRVASARSALNHPWFKQYATDTVPFSPFHKGKTLVSPPHSLSSDRQQHQLPSRFFQIEQNEDRLSPNRVEARPTDQRRSGWSRRSPDDSQQNFPGSKMITENGVASPVRKVRRCCVRL